MPKTPPLSVSEAAEQTGKPKRTIQHAITQGDLPAHKLAGLTGSYLIDQRELDKWLAKREAKAAS